MSDQCKHCTVRGNIEKCLETNCSQHESWMVLHIAAQLTTATAKIAEQSVRIEELEADKAEALEIISDLLKLQHCYSHCGDPTYADGPDGCRGEYVDC